MSQISDLRTIQQLKNNITDNNWTIQIDVTPEEKIPLLKWAINSKKEIVNRGWPPNPNMYTLIKQLSTNK